MDSSPTPDAPQHELVGLAAIFSFLVPGLGHLLIGAWLRGAIWFAGWLVVPAAGGGTVHPIVVALMVIAGLDALLYGRSRDAWARAARARVASSDQASEIR